MKVEQNNIYLNKRYGAFESRHKNQMANKHQNSVNFTGFNIADRKNFVLAKEAISNLVSDDDIIKEIDKAIGKTADNEGYLTALLRKANLEDLNIKKYTLGEGFGELIKSILLDIPNAISKKLTKKNIFPKRAEEKLAYEAMYEAREILEVFAKPIKIAQKNGKTAELDLPTLSSSFSSKVASGVANLHKNYKTKDERTLNRMVTSTVSALYSANDFYNISMLQKDNKEEANKAKDGRFKQEIKRMLLSGGLTYISLGLFDKITKQNLFTNAIVIAGSALVSEIISRVSSGTHLYPLSSEQAAKIAQKQKAKSQNNNQKIQTKTINPTHTDIKQNSLTTNNPFGNKFASKNGKNAYDILKENIVLDKSANAIQQETKEAKTKKKLGMLAKVLIAFAGANLAFWISKQVPKKVLTLDGLKPNKELTFEDMFKSVSDFITKKKTELDIEPLKENIDKIKDSAHAQDIKAILDQYTSFVSIANAEKLEVEKDRFFIAGLYSGVTKIFKTVYEILSSPSKLIYNLKNKTAQSDETVKPEKVLNALNEIIKKHKKSDNLTDEEIKKIVEEIKKNTRKIECGQETGDLANFSRTLVTAISTYFFVNDYRNRVLIESEGKDVQGAKEEMNERIAHKIANFIINGTLMNTANTLFRGPLNSSLKWATLIPIGTETLNEFLVRKSTCQPIKKMGSKQEILDYEQKQVEAPGLMGKWSKLFRKLTGKKTLTEKAGIKK